MRANVRDFAVSCYKRRPAIARRMAMMKKRNNGYPGTVGIVADLPFRALTV